MPKVSEVYRGGNGRKFLTAKDLKEPVSLTITGAETLEIKDSEKIVLSFKEIEQSLPLNPTNAGDLASKFGDETTAWIGQQIQLGAISVQFQGENTKGIRIIG